MWKKKWFGRVTMDSDSGVTGVSGSQEGAEKGYNPFKKRQKSCHPIFCLVAETRECLSNWFRPGETYSANGVAESGKECSARLPEGVWKVFVRADSAFFNGAFPDFPESKGASYLVKVKMKGLAALPSGRKWEKIKNFTIFIAIAVFRYHYKRSHELEKHDVQTFLVSSRTPRASMLKKFGWHPAEKPGVYNCKNSLAETVTLILLNELADKSHNAWIRCFASQRREKESAFDSLMDKGFFSSLSNSLQWFLEGLLQYLLAMGGENMEIEVTPDDVMKIGKKLQLPVVSNLPLKERLIGVELLDIH